MISMVDNQYLINNILVNDTEGKRLVYGIDLVEKDCKLCSVYDISISKTFVEKLVELFNKNELSSSHLYNALEDIL